MISIIDGDLFETGAKIICHQVNCQSRMGSGVALQVKKRFPHVYQEYKRICTNDMLGKVQLVPIHKEYVGLEPGIGAIPYEEQYICNLFAQDNYGYDGKQYTSTEAIKSCFEVVRQYTKNKNNLLGAKIAMPYKIGCVRGGADWQEVYAIMEEVFANCEVELWRLDKG